MIELAASPDRLESFVSLVEEFGIIEMARTGVDQRAAMLHVVCRVLRRFVEESEIVEMTGVIAMGKSFLPAGLFPEGVPSNPIHTSPVRPCRPSPGRPSLRSFVRSQFASFVADRESHMTVDDSQLPPG